MHYSNEEKFRSLTENTKDIFWHFDANFCCISVSPSDEALRGYKAEELVGLSLFSFLKPEGVELIKEVNAYRISEEKKGNQSPTMHFELEQLCKDGSWIWVEINSTAQYNDNNEIIGYSGVTRSIVERKRIEKALEHSRMELKTIYENAPVMMCLVNKNREILFSNKKFNQQFNNSTNESNIGLRFGNIIECIHGMDDIKGCGFGEKCKQCSIKETINKTFISTSNKSEIEFQSYVFDENGKVKELSLLASTAIMNYDNEENLLLCLTDITERKTIENNLQKSKERLLDAQKISHLGNWELDIETFLFSWSDEIFNIFEVEPEKIGISYEHFLTIVHPDDKDALIKFFVDSLKDNSTTAFEHRLVMPDGRIKWVLERTANLFDQDNNTIKAIGTVQDVTERHNLQQKLIESEEKYASVFRDSPIAISIKDFTNNTFIDINKAFTELLGYELNELKEIHPLDIDLWEDKDAFHSVFDRLHAGEIIRAEEYRFRQKSGSFIDGLLYAQQVNINEEVFMLCSVINITDKKIIQKSLEESENKYRLIANNTSDGIIVFDPEGKVNYISPAYANMMGYNTNEITGQMLTHTYQLIHPEDRDLIFKNVFDAIEKRLSSLKYSYRAMHKSGLYIWREDHASFMYDEHNNYLGSYCVCRDISERKRIENELKELNEKLEQKVQERTKKLGDSIQTIRDTEQKFRTLADYTYNWEYWKDIDNSFVYMSPSVERITGYTVEEFKSNPELIDSIVLKVDQKLWLKHKRNSIRETKNEEKNNVEFRILRKDGTTRWISHTCVNIFVNGQYKGIRVSNRDISKMKETQNELSKITSLVENRERNHFAQELHDGMGPLLSTIKLYFQWMSEMEDMDKKKMIAEKGNICIEQAIQTARELAKGLSNSEVSKSGFVEAILVFTNNINVLELGDIKFKYNTKVRFLELVEQNLFRIITELIKNTITYSKADLVKINFNYNEEAGRIALHYSDNGKGFDMQEIEKSNTGQGLKNIDQRIKSIGGKLDIKTAHGKGFKATITILIK